MKKALLFAFLCIVLCVPAFAESSHFSSAEIQWIPLGNVDYGNSYVRANDTGVYFYVKKSVTDGRPVVHVISVENNKTASYWRSDSDSVVDLSSNRAWGNYYTAGSGINRDPSEWTCTYSVIPYESDVSAGTIQSDFASFLENPPDPGGGGVTPGPNDRLSSFTLPRGNVAYFKVSVASDVNMISHMPTLNNLVQFGNNSLGPWGDTGQRWGYAAALPDSSTTFPLGSQVPLTWTKDSSQNILGQTKIGHASKACTTGQWYVFFNPGVSGMSANGMNDIAGASVDFSGYFSDLKVFPLSERLDYSNPLGGTFESYSDDGYASYFDGTINDNGTVTWENQDGELSSPAIGGQNAQYGDLSTEGLIKRVQEYLANILNEIKSLFTFGYEAIQSLVDIMSDFVNVFQGLYSWLPQPVHAALISAVSVAVVIGVFKVFL